MFGLSVGIFTRSRVRTMRLGTFLLLAIFAAAGVQASTSDAITLTWTAPGDDGGTGTATQYEIRYSTAPINEGNWLSAALAANPPAPQAPGTQESFTVTGLNPSATYYFAIKTADEVPNWSPISNVGSAATSAEQIAPSALASLQVESAASDEVTLSWTATGDDGAVGTASVYDVRYSTSAINEGNWDGASQASGEPVPKAAGGAESFTVAGLNPSTTYHFAIKVADEVPNWSGLSNVVNAATGSEQVAPAVLADLAVEGVTSGSVELSWTATGDDGAAGTAATYDIRYSTSAITGANWGAASQAAGEPAPKASGAAESFVVSDLDPSVTYYFAINVADEVPNWSGLSNVVSAETDPEQEAPTALADLAVMVVSANSITLAWTATGDDGADGTASQYDIRYSAAPITPANWDAATQVALEPAPKASGQAESFTVDGLQAEVAYYFAIKVADEVPNWSGLSNVVSATTPDQTAPMAISDLDASAG